MKFESLEKLLAYSIKILFCSTLGSVFSFKMTLQYSVIFKFFSLDLDSNKFISEGVNRKVIFSVLRFSILGRPPNLPHSLCLFFSVLLLTDRLKVARNFSYDLRFLCLYKIFKKIQNSESFTFLNGVKKARMGKRQNKNEGFCWLFPLLALFLNA